MSQKLKPTEQAKVDNLKMDYDRLIKKAMTKEHKERMELIREANIKLDKIRTIRKKAELTEKYGKPHGYNDYNTKIIE